MKIKHIAALAAVLIAAAAAYFVVGRGSGDGSAQSQGEVAKKKSRRAYLVQKDAEKSAVKPYAGRGASQAAAAGTTRTKKKDKKKIAAKFAKGESDGLYHDENGNPYPEEDQEIMSAAAAAIENDDFAAAVALAPAALASDNKELREMVVDALGWFGSDSIAELLPFLADPDEEIADDAMSQWLDALQDIEDDGEKAGIIEMTLKAMKDRDAMEDVANELIGIDELAAIQVIVNIIDQGGLPAEVVKESYDFITGDEWAGIDQAEDWLQENYDPPDEDDEG